MDQDRKPPLLTYRSRILLRSFISASFLLFCAGAQILPNDTIPKLQIISRSPRADGTTYKHSALLRFSPEAPCIKRRHNKISVDIRLVSSINESVEYLVILIVNGQPRAPFITTMLAGDMDLEERGTWSVFLPNPSNEVRVKIIAVREPSGSGERIADITRFYRRSSKAC